MYNVGDRVVYPMHGAGVIEDIQEREILGTIQKYYVLNIPIGNMKILVPISKMDDIGIRDLSSESLVDDACVILRDGIDEEEEGNWSKRYRDNMSKLRTGDIRNVAEVVHTLVIRERDKGLSTGEKKMLCCAKKILTSELILVKGWSQEYIDEVLWEHVYNNKAKAQ